MKHATDCTRFTSGLSRNHFPGILHQGSSTYNCDRDNAELYILVPAINKQDKKSKMNTLDVQEKSFNVLGFKGTSTSLKD